MNNFVHFKGQRFFLHLQGRLGNALLHKFAVATDKLDPPHTYVPWIVIDGDSDEESDRL